MPDTPDNPKAATRDDASLLSFARKRFKASSEGEAKLRGLMLEDKKFLAGDQWPAAVRAQREADGRPCLTIDRLTPQIKQVTNQQRAMRPSITVNPVAGGADPDTAEVLQGIVRHVESQSDADDAYDQGGRDQAEIGRGWIRVTTDYCDDTSFNQEIRIERVRNTFSVYRDMAANRRDYSDALFAFEVEDLLVGDFKARFPKAQKVSLAEFQSVGDEAPDWMTEDKIRVAKYWHVEIERTTLPNPAGGEPRKVEKRKVVCDYISGIEVLEHYDWPGKYIPLVPVIGEEIDIEGGVDLRGMVRRAKDPQRMFNFWKSATTEMIALAPKAPFIVAEGQLEGYEKQWKTANTRNHPVLTYKPKTLMNEVLPPPQRQVAEPPIQALMVSSQAAENDLRAATGYFDVDQKETREQSGKAIMARQQQGEHGNSDFIDGLARAVRHVGRIVIDLIPKIYDAPRIMRIVGLDNEPMTVMVHAGNDAEAQQQAQQQPTGVDGVFDVGVGTYDVTVDAGPSYKSARQEFVEQMAQIFQSQPQLFPMVGDLFFENMDIPNAKPIAERLKKLLPPALQDQGKEGIPPAAQAQMAQMGQQIDAMGAALQEAQKAVEGKQLELQSKQEIEAAKIQSAQAIKQAEIDSKEKIAGIQAAVDQHKASLDAQLAVLKLQAEQSRAALQADQAEQSQHVEHAHAERMADKTAAQKALDTNKAA